MSQIGLLFFQRSIPSYRKPLAIVGVIVSAVGAHLLACWFVPLNHPSLFLLPAVAVVAAMGGISWGLLAAGIAILVAVASYAQYGVPLHFPWDRAVGFSVLAAVAPTVALVVGNVHQRLQYFIAQQSAIDHREAGARDRESQAEADNRITRDQLKRSNEELDQFAYVTSHDLKAPLRGIYNLSTWIEEDLGPCFTPQAHEQMRLLRGRVERMEALINGLLEYSHVGRTQGKTGRVDVASLLAEVIDWIDPPDGIRIEVEPGMPVFDTDRIRLQQVFTNLIGNAVKHHGRTNGVVGVRCAVYGRFFRFSVSDDGPGIDPRYHSRIFGIFQTLLPRDRREGTGIGLSLAKKVVESKGGSIWVESTPGSGATFIFTWPRQPAADAAAPGGGLS